MAQPPIDSEHPSSWAPFPQDALPSSLPPDRNRCQKMAQSTPNGLAWAHRIDDLVKHDGAFWSPGMVKIADKTHVYEPSFRELVYGRTWKMPDEPRPRRLRPWPVLTMADGIPCPEELTSIKDATMADGDFSIEEVVEDETVTASEDATMADGDFSTEEVVEDETVTASEEQADKIPKLGQRIPKHLLPEILMIKDRGNFTASRKDEDEAESEIKYRRVYPKPTQSLDSDTDAPWTVARLELPTTSGFAHGGHAQVFRAHLTLNEHFALVQHNPSSKSGPATSATVRVVAKIADNCAEDIEMLENEGRIYDALPAHLSEDWSGFNAVRVPNACCMDTRMDTRVPATAVVPNFYGYFVPVEKSRRGMAILLLEDCGKPIVPQNLNSKQRAICLTFLYRLKHEQFMQHSFYDRNVLIQPGPLTHPPHRRSLDTPSFRLIDFGRGRSLEMLANGASEQQRRWILQEWEESFRNETTDRALCGVLRRGSPRW